MTEALLTAPQRKALVKMLEVDRWNDSLWKKAAQKFESSRNSKKMEFVRESVKKETQDLIDAILSCQVAMSEAENDLSDLKDRLSQRGFTIGSDGELRMSSSSTLGRKIEKRLDDEFGTLEEAVTKKFQLGTLKLWTVSTAAEAYKIVEELQNVQ